MDAILSRIDGLCSAVCEKNHTKKSPKIHTRQKLQPSKLQPTQEVQIIRKRASARGQDTPDRFINGEYPLAFRKRMTDAETERQVEAMGGWEVMHALRDRVASVAATHVDTRRYPLLEPIAEEETSYEQHSAEAERKVDELIKKEAVRYGAVIKHRKENSRDARMDQLAEEIGVSRKKIAEDVEILRSKMAITTGRWAGKKRKADVQIVRNPKALRKRMKEVNAQKTYVEHEPTYTTKSCGPATAEVDMSFYENLGKSFGLG